jgi:hypothetical protein
MKLSPSILRSLQNSLPGTALGKGLLYYTPTKDIISGFTIERTIERDRYYVWRLIMPLYTPADGLILDYSDRILGGVAVIINKNNLIDACNDILTCILSEGHATYVSSVRGAEDFLEILHQRSVAKSGNSKRLRDLAVTYYKAGLLDKCRETLVAAIELPTYWDWQSKQKIDLITALDAFDTKQRAWALLISSWEARTRSVLLGTVT